MSAPIFIHTHCHTAYSLAEGALKIKALVALAAEYHMPALAITDSMNLFGAYEFSQAASKAGIKPLIGCQISVTGSIDPAVPAAKSPLGPVKTSHDELVLFAQNEQGYRNLCRLVSMAYLENDGIEPPSIHAEWLHRPAITDGLICLTGGIAGGLFKHLVNHNQAKATAELTALKTLFPDRLYVEIQRHGLGTQRQVEPLLVALADQHHVPIIATNDCYFKDQATHEAHEVLLCIAQGVTISNPDRRKVTAQHGFLSQSTMQETFHDLPDAVANTVELAQRCNFMVEPAAPMLPRFDAPDNMDEQDYLAKKANDGLQTRLDRIDARADMDAKQRQTFDETYQTRLDYELKVIFSSGYSGYFLIVSDFIEWALDQDIPVGPGRGSGAGSLVAYTLNITNIDPIEWGLLFERFLNPERVSLPDFDVDFCPDKRDLVIKYVLDKYGEDRVGQIITFGSLQARAALRDVGRVLEIPYSKVDYICKLTPNNPAEPMDLKTALKQEPRLQAEVRQDEAIKQLFNIAIELEGLYRHASTHAAGVVISDKPLIDIVPLYRDPRSDLPTTQYSKNYAEAVGLVKFDFLGLKTLSVVERAVDQINASLPATAPKVDINHIPLDDPNTLKLFQDANTHGIFQLEGVGMRQWLKELKPNSINDIVALLALYRPGPMEQIPTYVACRWDRQAPIYPHESTIPFLKPTYGVAVYQEQVMQITQTVAGFSLGAADQFRRAIGKKDKSVMPVIEQDFVKGAGKAQNMPEDVARELFNVIAKFAGYGFNKSHAVAYAIIANQTAWLKANYPLEYYVGAMSQEIKAGSTDSLAGFFNDAKRNQITVLPVSINHPNLEFEIEPLPHDPKKDQDNRGLRYSMMALKGVNIAGITAIKQAHEAGGDFKNMFDFLERTPQLPGFKRLFETLICAGAFDALESNRNKLLENSEELVNYGLAATQSRSNGPGLFGAQLVKDNRPKLTEAQNWSNAHQLAQEARAVGFYLTGHPLDSLTLGLARLGVSESQDLETGKVKVAGSILLAGIVLQVKRRTITVIDADKKGNKNTPDNQDMPPPNPETQMRKVRMAVIHLSDHSGNFEAVLYDSQIDQYENFLQAGNLLLLHAKLKFDAKKSETTADDAAPLPPNDSNPQHDKIEPAATDSPVSLDAEEKGQMRLKIMQIEDLSSVIANSAQGAKITIHGDSHDFKSLSKALYETTQNGHGIIHIILKPQGDDGDQFELQMPSRYSLSADFEPAIRALGHQVNIL